MSFNARFGRRARPAAAAVAVAIVAAGSVRTAAAGGAMDLDGAVAVALERNPELQAARSRASAMSERAARAGALPNPRAAYMGMDEAGSFDPVSTPERRFEVEQMLPGPGKRGLKVDAARAGAEGMAIEVEALEIDLAADVRETAYELQGVRAATRILREEMAVVQRIGNVTATRVGAGQAGQADLVDAESEATMLALRLPDLEAKAASLAARLGRLLGREAGAAPDLTPAVAPRELPWTADALVARAAGRPEVRRAAADARRLGHERDLMLREGRPDYLVGLEYRASESEPDMAMFKIGVDLPVWRKAVAAGVREAGHMVRAGEAAVADTGRRAVEEVRDAHARWQGAVRTLALLETNAIPQARQRLAAGEADYRSGRGSFVGVMESERALLRARGMRDMAESEAGMQAARLARAAGLDPRAPWGATPSDPTPTRREP